MIKIQRIKTASMLFAYFMVALFALLFSVQAYALTISGTCKQADNVTDCTDTGTIRFATHAGGGTLRPEKQEIVAGTWTISGIPPQALGLIMTVFIEGAPDHQEAVAVFNYDGSADVTGVELIETHLSLGDDGPRGLSNLDLSRYDNSVSGNEDIFHDVDNTVSRNLTVDITGNTPTPTLYIKSNYAPGGDINAHHVEIKGTLGAGSNTLNVSGDWEMTNGVFNRDTSTVNFTGTGSIINDVSNWWNKPFHKLNIAAAGQTTTVPNNRGIVARDVATLGTGTLEGRLVLNKGTAPLINNGASFVNANIKFSPPANQPQFYIPAGNYPNIWLASNGSTTNTTFIPLGDITFDTLQVNGNGIGKTSLLETNGHNLTGNRLNIGSFSTNRTGKLTVNNGSTLNIANDIVIYGTGSNELDATSSTIHVGRNWSNSSLFTAGTSSVIFNGNNNQLITTGGDSFYNLTLDNAGASNSNIVTLQDPLIINNDLLVTRGKLDTSSTSNHPITVLGNLSQTVTGEIEAHASTITVNGGFNADGTLDNTNYNDASLILNGTGNLFYANISPALRSGRGFNNLTVGQAGQTTTSSNTFVVRNKLTIGSGAFTGTSNIYLRSTGNTPLNLDSNATISINSLRFSGSNQIIPPLNNGYDCNIKLSQSGLTVTQAGNITLNPGNHLFIDGDTFASRSVTYNTNGFNLNVGGSLFLGAPSGDTALKTLDISNSNVTVARNFEIRSGTNNLISTNSTVTLNGTGAQAVTMNGKNFNALTLTNTSASGVTFNDGFTANTLTNTTSNSTMTFAAGQDYTINNAVTLQGASGQLLNLISSAPGTHWNFILNAGASKSLSHVNVSWSDASGSHSTQKRIDPSNSTDGGNNIDWFSASELSVIKESTLISDPINGTSANKNHIPGAIVEYRVTVQNSGTASPDANTVVVYDSLDVNVEYDVTTGVVFSDGSTSSALTLGTVSYAHRTSPTIYTYSPTGAFDPNVASIKIETNGAFAFGGSPAPEFSVTFRVRVK